MFSKFFIHRPVFATVLSLLIILSGLVSITALPVLQYPNITPVQVQVTTTYPGADAHTVGTAVTAPIEAEINGVENMLYMTSTSSNTGQMAINVFFSIDTDPDIAQVLVQNRVNLAVPRLPEVVTNFGISVRKQSSNFLMIIAFTNPDGRYSENYLTTFTYVYILDAIKRINGAGEAKVFGVPDQAMRLWMNPDLMASLKITTSDIQNAVASQNTLIGAGQIGAQPSLPGTQLTLPVITQLPFQNPEEYEQIILRGEQEGSAIVRVGDVAKAEIGRKQYIGENILNGTPTAAIVIYQQAGANGLEVSNNVRKTLEALKKTLPDGIEYTISLDTTDFVRLSITEVIETLIIALILVILGVYLFLQSFKATFICSTAIIIALVGTFTGMLALGFSINLLTLFGLVLAIGIVIDDAIIVIENIERLMEEGLSPLQASLQTMQEVSGPVIATSLVLAAVFVPAAFLPGTTGQLYKQFAVTIIISVLLSSLVALTLTPALSALMLNKREKPSTGFFAFFNRSLKSATNFYGESITWVIQHKLLVSIPLIGLLICSFILFQLIPTSFIPAEDRGYILTQISLPDVASMNRTFATSQKVDLLFKDNPAVENRTIINGFGLLDGQYLPNVATMFVTLSDFDKRYENQKTAANQSSSAVLKDIAKQGENIETARIIPIAPPAIPGIGTTGGFEFWIQDMGSATPQELESLVKKFIEEAKKRPELTHLNTTFNASSMQLKADVDRPMAVLLGLPIQDVYKALQAQFGSLKVSQYEQFSRTWDVILQSDAPYREKPSDITKLYTRSVKNEMIPLSTVVKTSYSAGPDLVPHFNGFPAAQITGEASAGFSSGDAIRAMEEVAGALLPEGYGHAWSGMAFQEVSSGGSSIAAFVFGLIIVFLVLAAQYESWAVPCSVLTAVPFGLLGALIATYLSQMENDVYFQIGLLVLVGLSAKNAILIVEFAVELREKGDSILQSAVKAGKLRLRPILMTSLTFILGVLPLYFATGAGANARNSIGTGILGGMITASTLALIYVPLFFALIDKMRKPE